MSRRRVVMSVAVLGAVGAAVALTVPAIAGTNAPPGSPDELSANVLNVDPEIVNAMKRDLSLSDSEVTTRIRKERWAGRTESTLRAQVGTKFAGAWLTADADKLVVAVTDEAAAAKVRATGADAKVVSHTEAQLDSVKSTIDKNAKQAGRSVAGWYVDVETTSVVVVAKPGGEAAARTLVAASGVQNQPVRVVTTDENPKLLFDVRGADPYFINSSARCSIGFAVVGGFVTAGHCGNVGASTAGFNRAAQGTFKASSFPGNDYAFVSVNSNWTPTPVVAASTGNVTVAGSQEAAVGASICRSGSTTGTHCGTVTAKNATVNYAEGTVTGLTRTNVCAEPGDSGGSWMSGDQAQGVTSGGSGNCTSGGVTFFQPVNEILSANNLTLVTSGNSGANPSTPPSSAAPTSARPSATSARPSATSARPSAPSSPVRPSASATASATASQPVPPTSRPATPSDPAQPTGSAQPTSSAQPTGSADPTTPPEGGACTDLEASADGALAATGSRVTVPSGGFFRAGRGKHIGCLSGPSAANFDLILQRWTGRGWQTVARGNTAAAGADEHLTFNGAPGYYRYRVVSVEGSGTFVLGAEIP